MSRNTRWRKIVEFAAHAGDVRCVKIGRKTSGVIVTGGDDNKVNLFAVGRTTASLSLTGHSSSVESVNFDRDEQCVVAGAASGSIKLFDLDQGKMTRSLSGHKSNVLHVEFNPLGSALLSSSMDTNIKLWDMRSRDCTCTLKGHTTGVTHARFSPDGRLIASGAMDGSVKLWDITAGRVLADLCPPSGGKSEVVGVEFHPFEFLLATAAKDKVVRFWDMETLKCVDQTNTDATAIRAICFHSMGSNIFTALQDGMRVWGWEPAVQQDYVDVPWYKVADMACWDQRGSQRVLGCSFSGSMVGVYLVYLKDVHPFCDDPAFVAREHAAQVGASVSQSADLGGGHGGYSSAQAGMERQRSSNAAALPPPAAVAPAPPPVVRFSGGTGPLGGGTTSSAAASRYAQAAVAGDSADWDRPPVAVQPRARGSERLHADAASGTANALRPDSLDNFAGGMRDALPSQAVASTSASASAQPGHKVGVSIGVGVGDSLLRGQVDGGDLRRMAGAARANEASTSAPPGVPRPRRADPPVEVLAPPYPGPANGGARPTHGSSDPSSRSGSASTGHSVPRSMSGALAGPSEPAQAHAGGGGLERPVTASSTSEAGACSQLREAHMSTKDALIQRHMTLQTLTTYARKGDWVGALQTAKRSGDPSSYADLLDAMLARHREALSLDLVEPVVEAADAVLRSPYLRLQLLALRTVDMLVSSFADTITSLCGRSAQRFVGGIDIAHEERRDRAQRAQRALSSMAARVDMIEPKRAIPPPADSLSAMNLRQDYERLCRELRPKLAAIC